MFINTWERYFYRELAKSTGLFLFIFYGLYVLIDYSSHLSGMHYHHSKLKIGELLIHYGCEFSARADILLPFGLLIGTIKTLTKLNAQSELVSLLAGGHSLRRLLLPYVATALFGVVLLYANNEFILPKALHRLNRLDEKYADQRHRSKEELRALHLQLEDGSLLIYVTFNPISKNFHEAYWLASPEELWRMDELDPFATPPLGRLVDHFNRQESELTYQASYEEKTFPKMHFDHENLRASLTTPDQFSLSELLAEAPQEKAGNKSEKGARLLTALNRKLALPWLALLAVIGPAPFCLRFSRHSHTFSIFAGGIFGLVAIYLILDAATVLGERQVVAPGIAIFAPMGFFISLFLYRFIRIRT